MKRNEKAELRGKTRKELEAMVADFRQDLLDGRTKQVTEGESLGVRGRRIRRDIARILTVIREQEKVKA